MSLSDLFSEDAGAAGQRIRTMPTQGRSTARLSGLLDAAASVVDEVGFDRITTAMIAERANASIGTVYRYYPDRVAVLAALHERAVLRFRQRIVEELDVSAPRNWREALDCGMNAFVSMYRSEPGFRILHFTDRERMPSGDGVALESELFSRRLADVFGAEFDLPTGRELSFRLEVAIGMADSMLSRAFFSDPLGDERFIDECRRVVCDYLVDFYGPSVVTPLRRSQ